MLIAPLPLEHLLKKVKKCEFCEDNARNRKFQARAARAWNFRFLALSSPNYFLNYLLLVDGKTVEVQAKVVMYRGLVRFFENGRHVGSVDSNLALHHHSCKLKKSTAQGTSHNFF